jgi:hypothetical protein
MFRLFHLFHISCNSKIIKYLHWNKILIFKNTNVPNVPTLGTNGTNGKNGISKCSRDNILIINFLKLKKRLGTNGTNIFSRIEYSHFNIY